MARAAIEPSLSRPDPEQVVSISAFMASSCPTIRHHAGLLAFIVGHSIGILATPCRGAEPPALRLGPNVLGNGDFSSWANAQAQGVTTTTVGVPANSIAQFWGGGPGVGATATYRAVR